jgi:hypothetical protein
MLPRHAPERKLRIFTLMVGFLMGGVPLLFILPGIAEIYYQGVQRCPATLMPLVRISAIGLLLHPLTMAIRGYLEGKAAYLKKTVAILAGHAVYFVVLTGISLISIVLSMPGNLLPALAFFAANIGAALTMQTVIARNQEPLTASAAPDAAEKEAPVQDGAM